VRIILRRSRATAQENQQCLRIANPAPRERGITQEQEDRSTRYIFKEQNLEAVLYTDGKKSLNWASFTGLTTRVRRH